MPHPEMMSEEAIARMGRSAKPPAQDYPSSVDVMRGQAQFLRQCADAELPQQRRMREIGHLIATQDNRITDQPMFIVQQKQCIYGVDEGYTDLYHWCHKDGEGIADAVLAARLEEKEGAGRSTGKWEKIGYVEIWEFVTACFTEQGCIDYLRRNGHNLKETRIYAEGSFRNEEFRAVREFLMRLAEVPGA